MASGDDRIDVMESASSSGDAVKRYQARDSEDEDDDRDKSSLADKNASYDLTGASASKVAKSDRKIGHRRVGEGGEITYKKIQSTQIMNSIQLGIQHAIGGLASKPERDLLMQDFMTVETTNFPHEGSNHTPAHHYSEFRFRTYAPIAFRYFRDLFGIQPDDFLMSMCSSPLRELSNPGASGSIFYLTQDDEFIIKTVQHKEGEFLQKLLPGYYMNLNQNPRTLLPKFFGLYCYQCNSKNVRLIAMNNLLPSFVKLHQKYDLKGSTYKRKASKSERQKASPTYKDLDFMEHHPEGIFLEADTYGALIKTIQRDCRVLESFKIMDYSLLVGIHNLDSAQREKAEARLKQESGQTDDESETEPKQPTLARARSINRQRLVAHSTAMESIQAESEPIDEEEDVPPGGIPARSARGERLLLFVGVIDILQSYRLRKKLEHTFKSMIHDGDTVSVHRPGFYAQRFLDFMATTVFKKIPSLDLPEIKGNHRKFRTLVTSYIALKHSPSKRKSISRPLRPAEEIETPGKQVSGIAKPIMDYTPGHLYSQSSKHSPRSSLRSSLTDFTATTESTWHQPPLRNEYPSVLSDRLKSLDLRGPILRSQDAGAYPKRLDFDKKMSSQQMDALSEERMAKMYPSRNNQINGSLADSGIHTDNASTGLHQVNIMLAEEAGPSKRYDPPPVKYLRDVGVDTRNENSLQDIPFIDDDDMNDVDSDRPYAQSMTKHKSMTNIPERVDGFSNTPTRSRDRLSNSLNRSRSPTFIGRCKKFFTDLGLVRTEPDGESSPLRTPAGMEMTPVRSSTPDSLRETATLPKNMRILSEDEGSVATPQSQRKHASNPTVGSKRSQVTIKEATSEQRVDKVGFRDNISGSILTKPGSKLYSRDKKVAILEPTSKEENAHVSVIAINGSGVDADYSEEKYISEFVYVSSNADIVSHNQSGSTIVLLQPPD